MLTLCESQGAANYASSFFQNLMKEQGLDGAIVVCPAISEDFYMNEENPHYNLRIARDNWISLQKNTVLTRIVSTVLVRVWVV